MSGTDTSPVFFTVSDYFIVRALNFLEVLKSIHFTRPISQWESIKDARLLNVLLDTLWFFVVLLTKG